MEPNIRQLADAIKSLLTGGIRLSGDVIHYLNSAMGISTPEALEQMLAGPADCESESLCELVLFPDAMQQLRLEPLLKQSTFSDADVEELVARLARSGLEAVLIFPDGAGSARLPVAESELRQFIRRLKISRTIDARLARHIEDRTGGADDKLRLRVALRNARFFFSDNTVDFLCAFLARIAPETPDFMEMFGFCCDALERIGPDDAIYDALMARKRHCVEMIRQAQKSEKQLRQQPVEALIMRGISIACMGVDEARRQIGWIDRISLAVYGKTELIDRLLAPEEAQPYHLGVFEKSGCDIDKVIKILS